MSVAVVAEAQWRWLGNTWLGDVEHGSFGRSVC